jgi:Spy/CpxP family protein refolding chaperone
MKLKRISIATLAISSLLTVSPVLFAADTNSPSANAPATPSPAPGLRGRMMGPHIEQIAKDLNLNEDQTAKFKSLMESTQQKRRELFNDNALSREDRMAKMKTIQEDMDTQLKKILTPEQYDKWQKMPRPGMRRNQGEQGGGAHQEGDTKPANPPQE